MLSYADLIIIGNCRLFFIVGSISVRQKNNGIFHH